MRTRIVPWLGLLCATAAHAAGPDTAFGTNGQVVLQLPGDASSQAAGALIQSDGKIVVVGASPAVDEIYSVYATLDPTRDFLVARFNPDGSLDSGFGSGGIVRIDFGNGDDRAAAVIQQSDGKLLVIGQALSAHGFDFDVALARLDSQGNLDTTFNGTGKLTLNSAAIFSNATSTITNFYGDNEPSAAIQQADGKLLIAATSLGDLRDPSGYRYASSQLLRLLPAGSLDTSFGADSSGIVNLGTGQPTTVVMEPNGKILVVAGELYEVDPNGQTFTQNLWESANQTLLLAASCVFQPDGQFLLGGIAVNNAGGLSGIARATSLLDADSSFGTGGLTTNVGDVTPGTLSVVTGLLLEPGGNVIATAYERDASHLNSTVTRLSPNGSPDPNFGQNGVLSVSAGPSSTTPAFRAVVTLRSASGKLLVVGNGGELNSTGPAIDLEGYIDAASKRITIARLTSTPEYSFARAAFDVSESGGSINIQVTRTGTTSDTVKVSYTTMDGSAVAGTDYTATSGTLVWQPGDADTKTITVPVSDRSIHDGSKRQFALQLSAPSEGSLAADTATVSIAEDDPAPAPKSGGGSMDWVTLAALLGSGAGMLRSRQRRLSPGA